MVNRIRCHLFAILESGQSTGKTQGQGNRWHH